jgi:hypothetical protein
MTDALRYQSLGDRYTLERVYAAYGASAFHASGNASSACVPIHTATMMSLGLVALEPIPLRRQRAIGLVVDRHVGEVEAHAAEEGFVSQS